MLVYPHIPPLLRLPPTLLIPPLEVVAKHRTDLPVPCSCFPLAVLHLVVYICQCHSLTSSQLTLPPPRVLKSILYICVFIPVLPLGSSEPYFFFKIPYICVSIQYLFFSFWLTSLCMTDTRSIHLITNSTILFPLWLSNIPFYICTTSSLSIHMLTDI